MAKYLERPQKPAVVEAVQFTGTEDQVPTFNEAMPKWLFSSFLAGEVAAVDDNLVLGGRTVVPGSWIVRHEGGVLSTCSGVDFIALYRPSRKKPVRRAKSPVAMAAE